MKLTVNGEPREVQDGATVLSLLEELGVARERVAVEVNLEVVRRARHAEHPLRDGDHVEIVSFVGGG
ncbi:MAG: sulfur carrier protein ThiS [Myxococcota bacterium]|nr:sulfur carrier protein ThiS [Myxococcota bacterium]